MGAADSIEKLYNFTDEDACMMGSSMDASRCPLKVDLPFVKMFEDALKHYPFEEPFYTHGDWRKHTVTDVFNKKPTFWVSAANADVVAWPSICSNQPP